MKITFLYNGNSADICEWSNVPYFVTETFKELGHDINRVNMRIRYIKTIYDFIVTRFVKVFGVKDTSYNFSRSKLNGFLVDKKLKKVAKKYSDTDLFISISDNYNPYKYTKVKCVMLCDWTYEFDIVHDLNKKIDKFEEFYYKKQLLMMKHAYSNIILRDECREYVMRNHPDFVVYKGNNIVVQCTLQNIEKEQIISQKRNSNIVVFIGSKRYINGAKVLYDAVREIIINNRDVEVYFLGIHKEDIGFINESCIEGCHFCGYLNKGIEEDNKLYYELLMKAKMCINTNDNFVSIAALMEAGYLYNPVVISKHYQTISCYGENISCGYYCENDKGEIVKVIKKIFDMPIREYELLCQKCHDYFENATWSNVVSQWLATDFKG